MPAVGGAARPLTEGKGAVLALKWSHDGKRIGFIRREPETKEHEARAKAKNDAVEVDREHSFARLWIYDLASRQARAVTETGLNVDDFDWSPDDKRLAIRVTDTPGINDFYYHSRIRLLDPATGKWGATVTSHSAAAPVIRWSPDGSKLAYPRARRRRHLDRADVLRSSRRHSGAARCRVSRPLRSVRLAAGFERP